MVCVQEGRTPNQRRPHFPFFCFLFPFVSCYFSFVFRPFLFLVFFPFCTTLGKLTTSFYAHVLLHLCTPCSLICGFFYMTCDVGRHMANYRATHIEATHWYNIYIYYKYRHTNILQTYIYGTFESTFANANTHKQKQTFIFTWIAWETMRVS